MWQGTVWVALLALGFYPPQTACIVCRNGTSGIDCVASLDGLCGDVVCQVNRECVVASNGPSCECIPGYTGARCTQVLPVTPSLLPSLPPPLAPPPAALPAAPPQEQPPLKAPPPRLPAPSPLPIPPVAQASPLPPSISTQPSDPPPGSPSPDLRPLRASPPVTAAITSPPTITSPLTTPELLSLPATSPHTPPAPDPPLPPALSPAPYPAVSPALSLAPAAAPNPAQAPTPASPSSIAPAASSSPAPAFISSPPPAPLPTSPAPQVLTLIPAPSLAPHSSPTTAPLDPTAASTSAPSQSLGNALSIAPPRPNQSPPDLQPSLEILTAKLSRQQSVSWVLGGTTTIFGFSLLGTVLNCLVKRYKWGARLHRLLRSKRKKHIASDPQLSVATMQMCDHAGHAPSQHPKHHRQKSVAHSVVSVLQASSFSSSSCSSDSPSHAQAPHSFSSPRARRLASATGPAGVQLVVELQ
ncbi:hypothetical protein V8C86DRAFT_2781022 [Haematococcus lacustris]